MSRLVLILALLVVLPTAVLSLFTGRMLRNWETVLQARVEAGADRAVRSVAADLRAQLDSDWRTVRAAVAAALAPRGRLQDVEAVRPEVDGDTRLVAEILLFMDPLGFVYPDQPSGGGGLELLAQDWRRQLALAAGLPGSEYPLFLRFEQDLYCFGPLGRGPGMHVGYRVCADSFRRLLGAALAAAAGNDWVLSIVDPDDRRPVLISDLFTPAPTAVEYDSRSAAGPAAAFFSSPLPFPFEYLTVAVGWRDPGQAARAVAWQLRLYRWGIVLLVLCVALGGWIVLRQTALEARRLRQRSDLVMAISHDLRTPVAAIKMMAESLYLDRVRAPEQRREFVKTLISESDRLADMAERVLFFVRRERRAYMQAVQPLDAGEIVRTAVNVYRERMALHDSETAADRIQLNVAGNLPPVRADRRALMAVISNLLDNALTHGAAVATPPAETGSVPSPAVRVGVDLDVRGRRRWIRLSVRDFGPGIEPGERKKIFRRFYRGRHAHTPGSGLGLALCRDIVRAHGGRIEVGGNPGQGAEFRILLPARGEQT